MCSCWTALSFDILQPSFSGKRGVSESGELKGSGSNQVDLPAVATGLNPFTGLTGLGLSQFIDPEFNLTIYFKRPTDGLLLVECEAFHFNFSQQLPRLLKPSLIERTQIPP